MRLSILGFSAVNRDLTVELRDPITREVRREVRPFLDGTVRIPKVEAGAYEVHVRHPNLALPVLTRPIRVLPQGETQVSLVIDPSKFRNTPIEEIPDANLGPVTDSVRSIAETVAPLSAKTPGEAIRASDWNALAGAVRDLAEAVAELTRLVAPQGHDHPELVRKFDEVSGNFQALIESVSASLTELQRRKQLDVLEDQVKGVLTEAGIAPDEPRGKELLAVVEGLGEAAHTSPRDFGRKSREAGALLGSKFERLVEEKPDVGNSAPGKGLSILVDTLKEQRSTTFQAEIDHLRKSDRQFNAGVNARG
ncbi:MAG TPA: hypothetical protein PK413_11150 [Thermoanaerobaculia bacterium]|nr:hypothetical protein [Thermoanaerobaculia bacterium]